MAGIRHYHGTCKLKAQFSFFFEVFEKAVQNIGKLGNIDDEIVELGKRHKNYGTTKKNFDVSVEKFILKYFTKLIILKCNDQL